MQITNWNKYYANGKINIMLITTNIGDYVKYVLMAENVKINIYICAPQNLHVPKSTFRIFKP